MNISRNHGELVWSHVSSCTSTQDVARVIWERGEMPACVVTADRQSLGRGTWGRSWWSPPGNLFLSLTMKRATVEAELAVDELPLRAARVVAAWLNAIGARTAIKGVNDVLLLGSSDREASKIDVVSKARAGKVCGLLVEAWEGQRGPAVTLGLGLNCIAAPPWWAAQQATTSLHHHGLHISAREAARVLLPRLLAMCELKITMPQNPQCFDHEGRQ